MFNLKRTKVRLLEKENSDLKKAIDGYLKPLALGEGLTVGEWAALSESEQIMRVRKLDLVLTLKKTGRWDYEKNCAKQSAVSK